MDLTVPSQGATISFSIFMASITHIVDPAVTLSPTLTLSLITIPFIADGDVDFDEDYYRFEITEERNVSLELWHEKVTDSSVTWVASIIDENGNVVKSVDSSLNQGLVSTGVMTLKEGTYYVKIETGMYGSESPYYFKLVR